MPVCVLTDCVTRNSHYTFQASKVAHFEFPSENATSASNSNLLVAWRRFLVDCEAQRNGTNGSSSGSSSGGSGISTGSSGYSNGSVNGVGQAAGSGCFQQRSCFETIYLCSLHFDTKDIYSLKDHQFLYANAVPRYSTLSKEYIRRVCETIHGPFVVLADGRRREAPAVAGARTGVTKKREGNKASKRGRSRKMKRRSHKQLRVQELFDEAELEGEEVPSDESEWLPTADDLHRGDTDSDDDGPSVKKSKMTDSNSQSSSSRAGEPSSMSIRISTLPDVAVLTPVPGPAAPSGKADDSSKLTPNKTLVLSGAGPSGDYRSPFAYGFKRIIHLDEITDETAGKMRQCRVRVVYESTTGCRITKQGVPDFFKNSLTSFYRALLRPEFFVFVPFPIYREPNEVVFLVNKEGVKTRLNKDDLEMLFPDKHEKLQQYLRALVSAVPGAASDMKDDVVLVDAKGLKVEAGSDKASGKRDQSAILKHLGKNGLVDAATAASGASSNPLAIAPATESSNGYRVCTLKCPKALNKMPEVMCTKCCLLFHRECVAETSAGSLAQFVCQNCNKVSSASSGSTTATASSTTTAKRTSASGPSATFERPLRAIMPSTTTSSTAVAASATVPASAAAAAAAAAATAQWTSVAPVPGTPFFPSPATLVVPTFQLTTTRSGAASLARPIVNTMLVPPSVSAVIGAGANAAPQSQSKTVRQQMNVNQSAPTTVASATAMINLSPVSAAAMTSTTTVVTSSVTSTTSTSTMTTSNGFNPIASLSLAAGDNSKKICVQINNRVIEVPESCFARTRDGNKLMLTPKMMLELFGTTNPTSANVVIRSYAAGATDTSTSVSAVSRPEGKSPQLVSLGPRPTTPTGDIKPVVAKTTPQDSKPGPKGPIPIASKTPLPVGPIKPIEISPPARKSQVHEPPPVLRTPRIAPRPSNSLSEALESAELVKDIITSNGPIRRSCAMKSTARPVLPNGGANGGANGGGFAMARPVKECKEPEISERRRAMISWLTRRQATIEEVLQNRRIAVQVLKGLSADDLLRLRQVSRTLKELADVPSLWRTVRVADMRVTDWRKFFFFVNSKDVETLDFRGSISPATMLDALECLLMIRSESSAHALNKCNRLYLSQLPVDYFTKIAANFVTLKELIVDNLVMTLSSPPPSAGTPSAAVLPSSASSNISSTSSGCELQDGGSGLAVSTLTFNVDWLKQFECLELLKIGSLANVEFKWADALENVLNSSVQDLTLACPAADVKAQWAFISQLRGLRRLTVFDTGVGAPFPAEYVDMLRQLEELVFVSEGSFRVKCASRNGELLSELKKCTWLKRLKWQLVGNLSKEIRTDFIVEDGDPRIPFVLPESEMIDTADSLLTMLSMTDIRKELLMALKQVQQIVVQSCKTRSTPV